MRKGYNLKCCILAFLLFLTTCVFTSNNKLVNQANAAELWDTYSDTWVATDSLGRSVSTYSSAGSPRDNKFVGMFYFLYYSLSPITGTNEPADTYKILSTDPNNVNNPNNPPWGAGSHSFAEPIWGYYANEDEYVLKKQAQMLADAGVDTLIFDLSNFNVGNPPTGYYESTYLKLMQVFTEVRNNGGKTPQVMFLVPWEGQRCNDAVAQLYNDLYSQNLYSDLWFQWEGKPLIMADSASVTDTSMKNFFTYRKGKADYGYSWEANQWGWLSNYPQTTFYTDTNLNEEMCVSVAQNSSSLMNDPNYIRMSTIDSNGNFIARGRSYHNGSEPLYTNPIDSRYPLDVGYNFEEQWNRALGLDPDFIFVTGWNEWTAGRVLGDPSCAPCGSFCDTFVPEFSRDIEPMKGGYFDNYYYQLTNFIRKHKGVRELAPISTTKTILINGSYDDWSDVGPEFRDDVNDKSYRNWQGGPGVKPAYSNTTGRNDIKLTKVARDSNNIYFYVETVDDITSYTDSNWMRLFIKTNNSDPNWNGYNYVINRTGITSGTTTLEKSTGGWNWSTISSSIQYRISGNRMELAIPRGDLGLSDVSQPIDLQLKWHDNMQVQSDISEFYTNGDAAPNSRFNYRYTQNVEIPLPKPVPTQPPLPLSWTRVDDSDSRVTYSSGWSYSNTANDYLNNTVHYSYTNGTYAEFTFTGSGVKWIGSRNADHGKADIYIDGVLDTAGVDTFGTGIQQVLYSKAGLSNQQHTIKIVNTNTKNQTSLGYCQDVDAFEYGSPQINWTQVDDNDPKVVRSSGWTYANNASGYLNSTVHYTYTPNEYMEYSFYGSAIRWIGAKNPDHGKADIYIDGVLDTAGVDTFGSGNVQQVLYEKTGLSNQKHTVRINVTNSKNSNSSGYCQDVDAFQYGVSPLSWTQIDDSDPTITKSSGWTYSSNAGGYSNNTVHYTYTPSEYIEYTFTGRGIRWIGAKNPDHGKADVYIDNILVASGVDTYGSSGTQQMLFEKKGLPYMQHTIKIVVTNTKNISSIGYCQDIDALQYQN